MSTKQENFLFVKTPTILLRVPEYVRYFKANAVGVCYEVLLAHVNRVSLSRMSNRYSKNLSSYVAKLGQLYEESGTLAAFFTDESLAEAMFCDKKSVSNYRAALLDLKLVKVEKFNGGYIYKLGEVIGSKSGRTIGGEHEGFYIDAWFTMALEDKEKHTRLFGDFLHKKMGNPRGAKHREARNAKILEKNERHARVGKADLSVSVEAGLVNILEDFEKEVHVTQPVQETPTIEEDAVFDMGNYFPELWKLVSENSEYKTDEKVRVGEGFSEVEVAPIEDKESNLNVTTSASVPHEEDGQELTISAPDVVESEGTKDGYLTFFAESKPSPFSINSQINKTYTPTESFVNLLNHYENQRSLIKGMRTHIAQGAPRHQIDKLALEQTRLPHIPIFSMHPRFSLELAYQKTKPSESPTNKLFNALVTLREDVLGVAPGSTSSSEFSTVKGLLNTLLKEYKYEQVSYSIRQAALSQQGDLKFLVSSPHFSGLKATIRNYASAYNDYARQKAELQMQKLANVAATAKVENTVKEILENTPDVSPEMQKILDKEREMRIERRNNRLKRQEELRIRLEGKGEESNE